MAIVIFEKQWSGRTLEGNVQADTRQATEVYFVMSDSSSDNENTIRADLRCPKKGDKLSSDQFMVMSEIRIRKNGPLSWTLEAVYVGFAFGPNQSATQKLLTKPKKKWSSAQSKQKIFRSVKGDPLVNANKEPVEVEIDRTDALLAWTGYFQSFDPATIPTFTNTVNKNTLTSLNAPPRTGRIIEINADEVEIEGVEQALWQVTVQILFRFDKHPKTSAITGWDLLTLHTAHLVRSRTGPADSDYVLVTPVDANGKNKSTPVPISALGYDLPSNATAADLDYLQFEVYESKDWTPIGIT